MSSLSGNDSFGSFAPLDQAFSQSPHMAEFKDKLARHNPLAKRDLCSDYISPKSEEKINNNIDEIIGSLHKSPMQIPVEHFDLQSSAQQLLDEANQTSQQSTGLSFFKLLLLIILIIVLIYAIYCLFFAGNAPKSGYSITTSGPGQVSITKPFNEFFKMNKLR